MAHDHRACVRRELSYYDVPATELDAATDAYMERVNDGDEPPLAEWAEAYLAVIESG